MIKYAIPGMYELRDINIRFLTFMKDCPEFFYDDVEVEVVYGNPQFCIWDGGRIFSSYYHTCIEELEHLIYTYNNVLNVPCRYVFTNSILEEHHFKDRFCNIIVNLANNGFGNHVVSANDDLTKYLKENYSTLKFVSSTTKCLTNFEECKAELNKDLYSLVCLDYNLNKKIDFLKTFTPEEKEKTEILVNAICSPGCPKRKNHYYLNSFSHLNYGKPYRMDMCHIKEDTFYPDPVAHGNNLTYEEIKEIYVPMGFTHFKLEGRTWSPLAALLTYTEYMVKPEYKNYVIMRLLGDL